MPKQDKFNFETALQELNVLTEKMEQGDLELETSLKHFEQGVTLIRKCQTALKEAEQKVQILTTKDDELALAEYEDETE